MLNERGYRERIISKIFKRITINHSLPQSRQLTKVINIQEDEIRMSINLVYVGGTSEKSMPYTQISYNINNINFLN